MLQLSFLEPPVFDNAVPVWDALDETQRAEVITTLARVIAKAIPAVRLSTNWRTSMNEISKINVDHLRRSAIVYGRQSSQAQVEHNRESSVSFR